MMLHSSGDAANYYCRLQDKGFVVDASLSAVFDQHVDVVVNESHAPNHVFVGT